MSELSRQLLAMLFLSPNGLKTEETAKICNSDDARLQKSFDELQTFLHKSGLMITQHNNQYQLVADTAILPKDFELPKLSSSLSPAALEVLAIIAYQQPISSAEIEDLRGVSSEQTIKNLLEKSLIQEEKTTQTGTPKRVFTTSANFLRFSGISSIKHLPQVKDLENVTLKTNASQ